MSSMARSIGNEYDKWAGKGGYVAEGGFYGREPLPLQSWLWDDNGTLKAMAIVASGKVGFSYVSDSVTASELSALVWNATADSTERIHRNWDIPDDYVQSFERAGMRSRIMLRARVRKFDLNVGGATDNATLQLKLDIGVQTPTLNRKTGLETDGDALITEVTGIVFQTIADQIAGTPAASSFIPAKTSPLTNAGIRWMEADISAAFTSAQIAAIKAGGTLGLKVYPSAAIGTNLQLEVSNLEVVYTRNLLPANIRNKSLETRA